MAGYALSAATPAAQLFAEYGEQLYRFCLGRLRSREEAEDAVQSTFLRVHKALERGVVPEYEAAWLYKIAHNVCLTRRAALARNGQTVPLYDREDLDLALAAPEVRRDELWGLSDALAALSPKLRQAILLREWQGLSYAEIADAMETTVSAVETLIFRARRDLAAALSEERPARRRPKLVDLLAALLGPKLAAGAALLVLGSAGVGTAFELERHGTTPVRAPAPRTQPRPVQASLPIDVAIAVPQHRQTRSRPAHRTAHARPEQLPAAPTAQPPSTAAAPVAAPTSSPAPTAPAPAQAAATTVAAVTTAVLTPPTVEAPAVSVPALTVPAVDVPTVSVPSLTIDLGH